MTPIGDAFGIVAPYYNLVLVLIVIILFIKLFSIKNKKMFFAPWRLLLIAISVYIIEEVLTVFHGAGIIDRPRILNAIFELIIITIAIYMLLIEKQHLVEKKNAK